MSGEPTDKCLELQSAYSDLALESKDEMTWRLGTHGFLMKLSPEVPDSIQKGIKELTKRLLDHQGLKREMIDFFAIHPGGKRILEVIEKELNLSKLDNFHAYEVLRNHGNMSSPTVLFVLKSLFDSLTQNDNQKHVMSFAFGPGLTLESLLYKTHIS